MPRAMAVFAHPDDEVIALGARLGRFRDAHLVHATDGAPRNEQDSLAYGFAKLADYRRAREHELDAALSLAGLTPTNREGLCIPDQEASLSLRSLTLRIDALLQKHQPQVLFTHPYEGGHPDHDACAFAVHHAVALQQQRQLPIPVILEAPFYNARDGNIAAGSFLANGDSAITYELSDEERTRKQALIACFTTQRETLRGFPVTHESYRIAPQYDFSKPPHAPPVLYDRQPWGMSSRRFCELACEAEQMLQEEGASQWR